ncbi:MAG: GNAT family N-acetyltransferase [Alphaproteobacteria bacterium]
MPGLGSRPGFEPSLVLHASTVYLRYPDAGDFEAWAGVRSRSRAFLEPWEPLWPADDLSRAAFRRRVRRYHQEIRDDVAYPFFLFCAQGDILIGALTLSNIRRGVSQSASLGYWIGEPFAGRGHMSAAVRRLAAFVFQDLRLHRIEAACIPTNESSQRVLLRCGFRHEGLARGYLKINGRWQDHLLFALLAEDIQPV